MTSGNGTRFRHVLFPLNLFDLSLCSLSENVSWHPVYLVTLPHNFILTQNPDWIQKGQFYSLRGQAYFHSARIKQTCWFMTLMVAAQSWMSQGTALVFFPIYKALMQSWILTNGFIVSSQNRMLCLHSYFENPTASLLQLLATWTWPNTPWTNRCAPCSWRAVSTFCQIHYVLMGKTHLCLLLYATIMIIIIITVVTIKMDRPWVAELLGLYKS